MPSTDWMWRARLGAWALLPDSPRMHPNAFSLSHGAPGPPGQEHPAPPPRPQCTSAPRPSTALRLWRGSFALWCPGRGTQGRSWAPAAGKGLESRDRVPARPPGLGAGSPPTGEGLSVLRERRLGAGPGVEGGQDRAGIHRWRGCPSHMGRVFRQITQCGEAQG